MDGFKKRLNASVQFKLSFSLSLAILVMALLAGLFSFISAFKEAHALQDDMLRQVAALFDHQHRPLAGPKNAAQDNDEVDDDSRVFVQYLVSNTTAPDQRPEKLLIPATLPDGMHTQKIDGEMFRIFVKATTTGERIAVAQETSIRDEVARHSALRTLIPYLILMPVLLWIVSDLVRKIFRPIAALSAEIDQRDEQALHSIEETHLPAEVRPFVVAINRLLARVDQSMDTQRRFVANAAHELRSPLTALSLQAERLHQTDMSGVARDRLLVLRRGIERGRNLLEQLLTLARAQATFVHPKASVSVQHSYRRVLEDLLPLAEARNIDIGVEGDAEVHVWANDIDLVTIIKNLVDNAIRYTPDGGRVDLSVGTSPTHTTLHIRDTGPGIPVAEREQVFDPFYRITGSEQTGSGLGLSIVKTLCLRLGAEIQLDFSEPATHTGLCVCIRIPTADGVGTHGTT